MVFGKEKLSSHCHFRQNCKAVQFVAKLGQVQDVGMNIIQKLFRFMLTSLWSKRLVFIVNSIAASTAAKFVE
jgi:hypothetical protein